MDWLKFHEFCQHILRELQEYLWDKCKRFRTTSEEGKCSLLSQSAKIELLISQWNWIGPFEQYDRTIGWRQYHHNDSKVINARILLLQTQESCPDEAKRRLKLVIVFFFQQIHQEFMKINKMYLFDSESR